MSDHGGDGLDDVYIGEGGAYLVAVFNNIVAVCGVQQNHGLAHHYESWPSNHQRGRRVASLFALGTVSMPGCKSHLTILI